MRNTLTPIFAALLLFITVTGSMASDRYYSVAGEIRPKQVLKAMRHLGLDEIPDFSRWVIFSNSEKRKEWEIKVLGSTRAGISVTGEKKDGKTYLSQVLTLSRVDQIGSDKHLCGISLANISRKQLEESISACLR